MPYSTDSTLTKHTIRATFIVILLAIPLEARTQKSKVAKIIIRPVNPASLPIQQLLPAAQTTADTGESTEANAYPLYQQAIDVLNRIGQPGEPIDKLLELPLDQLPRQKVSAIIEQFQQPLNLVRQAAQYPVCTWPQRTSTADPVPLCGEYRQFAKLLALQTRFHLAQGRCDLAFDSIQTSLMLARHQAQGSTIIQGLIGVSIADVAVEQLEQFVQAPGAATPYPALTKRPVPFIDIERCLNDEVQLIKTDPAIANEAVRNQAIESLEQQRSHILAIAGRLDRQLAMLQIIELLRLYTTLHPDALPESLGELTDIPIPDDPTTGRPFDYRNKNNKVILSSPPDSEGKDNYPMQYKVTLKPMNTTQSVH